MTFRLTSPNFVPDRPLPVRQTSDGEDFSPALDWGDPPPGTKSFALIVHDPDAPDPASADRVVAIVGVDGRVPTPETMEETLRFCCELPVDSIQFSVTTPFPGTEHHARATTAEVAKAASRIFA